MKIPFAKPQIDNKEVKNVFETLKTGILVHGKKTTEFEKKLHNFIESKNSFVSTTGSCTASMHLFYFAKKIKKNDEVILPAQSHVATAHAIELAGGKPIFVDSNSIDGNIDVNKIEKKISKKTVGVCVTHFLGKPVQMQQVSALTKKYKLFLIEDCALALGAKIGENHVGTFGDFGAFSFHPVKIITTAEGGAYVCKNSDLNNYIKSIKAFGYDISDPGKRKMPGNYNVNYLGFNYRMNELEASIGIEQLKKINVFLKKRKFNFHYLKDKLNQIDKIKILKTQTSGNLKSSYYALTIILDKGIERNKMIAKLKKKGIGTSIYYPHPIPMLNYYKKKYGYKRKEFPNACEISYKSIALPVGPHLKIKDMDYISNCLNNIINEK
tara:strand:+ start:6875 stop:8020 length:1146 start_codon:yes stop_codon:yes gene_type:complete